MNLHKKVASLNLEDLIIEDLEDFTVVNKPAFLSSLEDRNDSKNILSLAKEMNEHYQVCHRLDKETSGVIVLAKNQEAYRHFAMQLENREVKKVYHAVIHGRHKFEDFEAEEPLYTTTNKSRVDFKMGKPSFTLISSLEIFKKSTLVKCFPVTGRMHQIRAHLAYHETPIVSDGAYGGKDIFLSEIKRNYNIGKNDEESPMINRVALHAYTIAFKNMNGQVIEIDAAYPKDYAVLLKLLRKYN